MDKRNLSFTVGKRLKDLRTERKLSHDKLIKQLNDKYDISISRDSLIAYEIADETRAKANKLPNLGMRLEYLYCLADFFGVSLDYLVGNTSVRKPDCEIQAVCKHTGLSENAVLTIREMAENDPFCLIETDRILQNKEVLVALSRYVQVRPVDGCLIVDKIGGIRNARPNDALGPMDLEKFPVSEIIESALLKDLVQKIDRVRRK